MSRPVIIRSVGWNVSRSSVRSGQPSVANGHSAELNQVSSTSGSWVRSLPPQGRQAWGVSTVTVSSPHAPQVHTGIRWPHQIWREMHQSRMFSSHSMEYWRNRSGT